MIEKLKNRLVPLLFGTSVATMIIRCYHPSQLVKYGVLFFSYAFLCFAVFDLVRKTKKLSGLIYICIFAAVVYVCAKQLYPQPSSLSFEQWFYGAQTRDTQVSEYTFVLVFGGGFFLISVLYYFTQVIYRAFGTMLIMFFPLFIYAKRTDEINTGDFVVVLFFYILVLVHNRQMKSEKDCRVILNKDYVCSVGLFVATVTFAITLVPRPQVVSKQEQNQDYFNNMVSANAPSNFSDASNLTGAKLSDEVLFYVKSDRSMYLRRQGYDYYDGERWYVDNDDEYANKIPKDNADYSFNTTNYSYVNFLSELSDEGYLNYPAVSDNVAEKRTVSIGTRNNFNPFYVMLPLNTVEIDGSVYEKMCHGEYKPLAGYGYTNTKNYAFSYYPLTFYGKTFLKNVNFTADEILNALDNYSDSLGEKDFQKQDIIDDIYFETQYVSERFDDYSVISPEVCDLAKQITANLSTPYEKAKALEGYFQEENFEYELNVYPDSVEDFLFDEQAGACGDFATAMTLMARSCGLKARYVEGFAVVEKFDESQGTYVVREYHSHAYVEVYINGFGWVVFDPTVDGMLDYYTKDDSFFVAEIFGEYYKQIIALLAVAVVLWIFKNPFFEVCFLVKLAFSNNEKAVVLCYNRLVTRLSKKLGKPLFSKTPQEISQMLSENNIDKKDFVNLFEKVCYGNATVDRRKREFAVGEYKSSKRAISKLKINY